MTRLVLVPGAWHGPACFDFLIPLLEAAGHEAVAVDLPIEARSMAEWVAVVRAAMGGAPAMLLGHSRGGMVISAVAEAVPDAVAGLIYLAAFVPQNGQSLLGITRAHGGTLMPLEVDESTKTCLPGEVDVTEMFYHDCGEEAVAAALGDLRPEPLFGLMGPVRLSPARFGAVPKYYIACTADRAISLTRQRQMQAAWPMRQVAALETGHSPFYAAPGELAAVLDRLMQAP